MMKLLEAMARQEGFFVIGSRPQKNNNPGDIEYGGFASKNGAIKGDPRFAIFPDIETGYKAMAALLLEHYNGMTIEQALNKYAPPVENQTNVYIEHICEWTGLSPTDIISEHLELPEVTNVSTI
jgi:hypothetical protein